MNIVYCADRSVLPGLHVAAYSLLDRISPAVEETRFTVLSEALSEADITLLRHTLGSLNKRFSLNLRRVDASVFSGLPMLNGSYATYYRLFAPQILAVERYLYVDADTLCDLDVSELQSADMRDFPAGWVPEAPLAQAVDRVVAEELGNSSTESYFNAGVTLVNVKQWLQQRITEKALEYITKHRPAFHDQSALNSILRGNALSLDAKFNCMSNMRKNWPALKAPYGKIGRLVHFLDYPKPWDWLGEVVHPQHHLWRSVMNRTAMNDFRSWQATPARKFPRTRKTWMSYKKAAKDKFLFAGFSRGWLKSVKGVK